MWSKTKNCRKLKNDFNMKFNIAMFSILVNIDFTSKIIFKSGMVT